MTLTCQGLIIILVRSLMTQGMGIILSCNIQCDSLFCTCLIVFQFDIDFFFPGLGVDSNLADELSHFQTGM